MKKSSGDLNWEFKENMLLVKFISKYPKIDADTLHNKIIAIKFHDWAVETLWGNNEWTMKMKLLTVSYCTKIKTNSFFSTKEKTKCKF